jgi:hypothetical protein
MGGVGITTTITGTAIMDMREGTMGMVAIMDMGEGIMGTVVADMGEGTMGTVAADMGVATDMAAADIIVEKRVFLLK